MKKYPIPEIGDKVYISGTTITGTVQALGEGTAFVKCSDSWRMNFPIDRVRPVSLSVQPFTYLTLMGNGVKELIRCLCGAYLFYYEIGDYLKPRLICLECGQHTPVPKKARVQDCNGLAEDRDRPLSEVLGDLGGFSQIDWEGPE